MSSTKILVTGLLAKTTNESVNASTIGISDDNSSEFVIVFADYCNCSDSINGENIYTETLIDILQYLEEYLSKL